MLLMIFKLQTQHTGMHLYNISNMQSKQVPDSFIMLSIFSIMSSSLFK